jgi:hypothetical protein
VPIILIAGVLTLSVAASVLAQGNYTLFGRPTTAANSLSGDTFELAATVGQPDVGSLSGDNFTLEGGVGLEIGSGPPDPELGEKMYLPFVIRQ